MVLMRVADQDGRQSAFVERLRKQARRAIRSIQGTPGVQNNSLATRMSYLNAASTNLLGTAMNGYS